MPDNKLYVVVLCILSVVKPAPGAPVLHHIVLGHQYEKYPEDQREDQTSNFPSEVSPKGKLFVEVEKYGAHARNVKEDGHAELDEEAVGGEALLLELGVNLEVLLTEGHGGVADAVHHRDAVDADGAHPVDPVDALGPASWDLAGLLFLQQVVLISLSIVAV